MKTMTCKQLHGPCDAVIHGTTAEEMMDNSKKHAMDMVAKGDVLHTEAMKAMETQHMNMQPEQVKQFWTSFKKTLLRNPKIIRFLTFNK